jgi:hypothetical protein
MTAKFNTTSEKRLTGVHPHLVSVARRALEISEVAFQVTCGPRTLSEQKRLVKLGASRTLKSRHIPAPNDLAHAIDVVAVVAGKISWAEPLYHTIADAMKTAAREMGLLIEWGGDWRGFFDGVHFQLPWAEYPGVKAVGEAPPPKPDDVELMTLLPGAKGGRVVELQLMLDVLGWDINADGDFGPKTRAAVIAVTGKHLGKPTAIITAGIFEKLKKLAARSMRAEKKAA